ncbi:ribonucleoside-diphosphate reductase subunit alpha, partial [Bacillus sp. JJ1474]
MDTYVQTELDLVLEELNRASNLYKIDVDPLKQQLEELKQNDASANQFALLYSLNKISMDQPNWTFLAAQLYLNELYSEASKNRGYKMNVKYGDFYSLIMKLTNIGIYSEDLLAFYSKEEIDQLDILIDPEKDYLFNYIGLFLLADRYLAKDYE